MVAVRDAAVEAVGRRAPVLVKLGDLGDAAATVTLLAELGVDGVVLLNTQRDYAAFDAALPEVGLGRVVVFLLRLIHFIPDSLTF